MHEMHLQVPGRPWADTMPIPAIRASTVDTRNLEDTLARDGIAFFDAIEDSAHALRIAKALGDIRHHRDANEDGLTVVAPTARNVGNGYLGFGFEPLFPHTDRTVAKSPPHYVLLWCEQQAELGGESLLVDGEAVFRELTTSWPDVAEKLSMADAAIFESDGAFLKSPVFFQTEDPQNTTRLAIRFRYDRLMYVNCMDSTALPILRAIIMAKAIKIRLRPGQGYVVSNTRWLHGREGFRGERRFMRLLVDSPAMSKLAIPGFLPRGQGSNTLEIATH